MRVPNGGPAFPRPFSETGDAKQGAVFHSQAGMSLRDYFAAKAMQSLIAKSPLKEQVVYEDGSVSGPSNEEMDIISSGVCSSAYEYADAMLAEREPRQSPRTELNEREKAGLAKPHPNDFGIPKEHWAAAQAYAEFYAENRDAARGAA